MAAMAANEKAGHLPTWGATLAGTETVVSGAQTARAVAPVIATDTALEVAASHGADAKQDAGSLATASLAPSAPLAPASPAVAQVAAPVGSPDWAQQLGDRVAVLVNQNLTNAQIKLSPTHLGPLEIRISLSDGQASVAFTTHSQVTREALEAAAPRLHEALSAQGFGSVNVDVSQQQFRERTPQTAQYDNEFSVASSAAAMPVATSVTGAVARAASLLRLDAYA